MWIYSEGWLDLPDFNCDQKVGKYKDLTGIFVDYLNLPNLIFTTEKCSFLFLWISNITDWTLSLSSKRKLVGLIYIWLARNNIIINFTYETLWFEDNVHKGQRYYFLRWQKNIKKFLKKYKINVHSFRCFLISIDRIISMIRYVIFWKILQSIWIKKFYKKTNHCC